MINTKLEPPDQKFLSPSFAVSQREKISVILLILFGFVVRSLGLSHSGLNTRELLVHVASHDLGLTRFFTDLTPPLFPLLIRPFQWLGIETGPRFFSVIFGMVFCLLLWWITRSGFGKRAGLLALLFAVAAPQMIWLSRLALAYQFYVTCVALMLLAFLLLRDRSSKKRAALFVAASTAGVYTFYPCFLPLVYFLILALIGFVGDRKKGTPLLLTCLAPFALFLPKLIVLAMQFDRIASIPYIRNWESGLLEPIRRSFLILVAFSPAAGLNFIGQMPTVPIIASLVFTVILLLLLVFGVAGAVRKNRSEPSISLLLGMLFFSVIGAATIHWVFRLPMADHYLSFAALASLPLTACACLLPSQKGTRIFLIVLLVITNLLAWRAVPDNTHEDFREAVFWIDQRADPEALVLTISSTITVAYDVYGKRSLDLAGLPRDLPGYPALHPEQEVGIESSDREAFAMLIQGRNEVYMMTSRSKFKFMDRGLGYVNQWMTGAGYELKGIWSGRGVALSRFILKPGAQQPPT